MKEETPYEPQINIELLDEVLAITKIGRAEAQKITEFIRTHIDENCKNICNSCPGQKRYALKRVKMWAISNKIQIEKDREYYNKLKDDEEV